MTTYDVYFNNSDNSNSKGFKETFDFCKNYIESRNGTQASYFPDYKGGTASIVCNETGVTEFETEIK